MYSDLRNKTIFDFTDDESIIANITCEVGREKYLSDLTIDDRYIDFLNLADLTEYLELERETEKQLVSFCKFNLDYSDLKNKTIFDFTDDKKIIKEILLGDSRKKYLSDLTMFGRHHDFLELADLTKDRKLEREAEKQFKYLYADFGGLE